MYQQLVHTFLGTNHILHEYSITYSMICEKGFDSDSNFREFEFESRLVIDSLRMNSNLERSFSIVLSSVYYVRSSVDFKV